MKAYLLTEEEIEFIFKELTTRTVKTYEDLKRIKDTIMQKPVPLDAIGFLYPPRVAHDPKYSHSFFPEDWKK